MTASGQRARSGAELLATCEVAGTLTNLAAGAECIAQARVVLTEAARIGDLRDAASGTIAGELRLGVIPTLSPYLLPAVLDVLAERHPGIELVVEESVTESVLEALRTDGIDVGLVATPTTAPGIVSRTLFREPFTASVGAGHRLAGRAHISVNDLSPDDVWLLADGHCFRVQVMTLCPQRGRPAYVDGRGQSATVAPMARFDSGNLETLKRLVERGNGMTLLPALAAADLATAAQRKLLIPFDSPVPGRSIRLVRRRHHVREHLVHALVQVVRDVATATLASVPTDSAHAAAPGSISSRQST